MFDTRKYEIEGASRRKRPLTPAERQTEFLYGAALALIPAMFLVPLWFFLLRAPRFAHGRTVAALLFSVLAGLIVQGVRKLIRAMNLRELDLTTATSFGVLVVLVALLGYAAVVLFAVAQG
jgi:hypothetical protein